MAYESKYSYEEKLQVCNWYVIEGSNSIKASKRSGIPANTIRAWTQTNWWAEMVQEVRKHHQDRLDGKFTYVIDKLYDELVDRVKKGDEVWDSRSQRIVRRAMSGKDTAAVLSTVIEKRALLRGDPTSRTASASTDKQLESLQKKLEDRIKNRRKEEDALVEESENVEKIRSEG